MEGNKVYENADIKVYWKPGLCQHSANCVRGLPEVFNAKAHPWINMQGASSDAIVIAVKNCPSGALSVEHK